MPGQTTAADLLLRHLPFGNDLLRERGDDRRKLIRLIDLLGETAAGAPVEEGERKLEATPAPHS